MASEFRNERERSDECKRDLELAWYFCLDHLYHFPDSDEYDNSLWAMWESRIDEGQKTEEKLIDKAVERWESGLTAEQRDLMPDDIFIDDYLQTRNLTNSMYAALVVSLWSRIEDFLKNLVDVCMQARNSREKFLYKFEDIEKAFEKKIGISLETLSKYSTINAIRILNNSFKHSDGYYMPEETKAHKQIEKPLIEEWNILTEDSKINYTKLPIRKLVPECNSFFKHLISAIKEKHRG